MDVDRYLTALRRDSQALLDAARAADPGVTIEACPAWQPIDLVWHIAEVHHFWGSVVIERATEYLEPAGPARPATDEGTYAAADASAARLLDALSTTDPGIPVWTWSDQHDVGWVVRRMAQETAVHRWDAERAAGNQYRIDAELASDGIDELLQCFLIWVDEHAPQLDASVHLHCTDVEGEWIVRPGDDGDTVDVQREHAKGDAAIRGDAHDLLMVLWRRAPLSSVDVVGDTPAAERLVARSPLSTFCVTAKAGIRPLP